MKAYFRAIIRVIHTAVVADIYVTTPPIYRALSRIPSFGKTGVTLFITHNS